jgi:hypothetical protein
MIRFILGLLMTLGSVGTIEQSVGDIPLMSVMMCLVGLCVMAWSVNSIREQGN